MIAQRQSFSKRLELVNSDSPRWFEARERKLPHRNELCELIDRVRAGDAAAAADLVRLYEPAIRRAARLGLSAELQRECDSIDISQSVLGSFFWRVAAGHFDTGSQRHVMRLLITLARNKVRERARRTAPLRPRRLRAGGQGARPASS